MKQKLDRLKKSPAQTAGRGGQDCQIGSNLPACGRRNLGLVLVGPDTQGERILLKEPVFRWKRHATPGRVGGDMASSNKGRQKEAGRGGAISSFPAGGHVSARWRHRRIQVRNHQDRARSLSRRPHDGTARDFLAQDRARLQPRECISATRSRPTPSARSCADRDKVRVPTLVAQQLERDGLAGYRLDIRLQGENETVFFDI